MTAAAGAPGEWLLYGATGYTGELVAREAVRRGRRPVLAGRDPAAVARLARELDLTSRVFALDEPAAVERGLAGRILAASRPELRQKLRDWSEEQTRRVLNETLP